MSDGKYTVLFRMEGRSVKGQYVCDIRIKTSTKEVQYYAENRRIKEPQQENGYL